MNSSIFLQPEATRLVIVRQIFGSADKNSCVVGPLRLLSDSSGNAKCSTFLSKAFRSQRLHVPL